MHGYCTYVCYGTCAHYNDSVVQWLEDEFLGYLTEWESSVSSREGFSPREKESMLLSSETRLGLTVTGIYMYIHVLHVYYYTLFFSLLVRSFIELVKYIFTIPGVSCFLSERISQDPLENFFGCQRQRGGTGENPNVASFCKNTQALRVINTTCINVRASTGNCRGNKEQPLAVNDENKPIPKRRRKH